MRVCFVCTYPPDRAELGGSGWVDRRLLTALRAEGHEIEIVSVTGPPGERSLPIDQTTPAATLTTGSDSAPATGVRTPGIPIRSAGRVPLEVRDDPGRLLRIALGMLVSGEPYLSRKFTAFPGWSAAVSLLGERAKGRRVITSGWPGLLLAEHADVDVVAHIAHNVETVIAREHSPRPLRLLGEAARLGRAERRLLARPAGVYALSRLDAERLAAWGVPAQPISVPLCPQPGRSRTSDVPATIGFIGKAGWPPNARALEALLGPVHDRLGELDVRLDYVLAGRGTEAFADHPRVRAAGPVDSVSDFYRRVGLAVIPRFGSATGISVKVLEAAEHGVASVLPAALAEAIDPAGPWLIADDPVQTADAILRWRRGEHVPPVLSWAESRAVWTTPAGLWC
ncbi:MULTISPECIES: glycosyltransferase [Actinoalloteichus]|uniref:Glycosyl transferase 4-like domain/Glycosyl transferases group 1 n=1 Tax=Actinoalloteichus fjordicus TaxID=1612552 RepID=A0AAC9PV59_9PSEU|nr:MULTISPECIES: glycosyltransferase [Actinoalloteichus]APU17750.1 Glycosyl transferase 4-like domain/Glycosyl transferases group 1 [Actinoalloteichus fjordicus]APU23828.1 Glycosyl transferase 4-like domain/Glycosyl transferases group 1 [Actinoalloteichus sp. GBA129-24]